MGYDAGKLDLYVYWRVSRHNSERDREDDLLADELRERCTKAVEAIVSERRYLQIQAGCA